MKRRRFQVEQLAEGSQTVTGKEAEHAIRVLRLGPGDGIILFDGDGREVEGAIESVGQGRFDVRTTGPIRDLQRTGMRLVLAVATPKGDRADWLVEKSAELGVQAVRWISTQRGQVAPGLGKMSRWRRKAGEAAKQAGHARVMEVDGPMSIDEAIAEGASVLFGDFSTESRSLIDLIRELNTAVTPPRETVVFIGPEGGFTESELAMLTEKGGIGIRLADSILRIETAAVSAAAIWACASNSMK